MKNKPATDDGSKTSLLLSIRGVEEKKNYLHREEKERKHVDTDNTIVRERTRREEERNQYEQKKIFSLVKHMAKISPIREVPSKKTKTIRFRLYLVESFATLWKNIVEV